MAVSIYTEQKSSIVLSILKLNHYCIKFSAKAKSVLSVIDWNLTPKSLPTKDNVEAAISILELSFKDNTLSKDEIERVQNVMSPNYR